MDIEKILADVTSIEISVINLNLDLDTRGLKNYIYDKFTKFLLKKKAKELAKNKNFNASNFEKSITPYEKEKINEYIQRMYPDRKNKAHAKSISDAQNSINSYKNNLNMIKNELESTKTQNLTTSKLEESIENSKKSLQYAYDTKIQKLNSLLRFKDDNKLDVSAHFPTSKIFFWGLLFIVLILESAANAYFYAQGSDLGLLGGILQAFLVSVANLVISFGIGFILFRYTNHISKLKKIMAWIGIGISFFVISFLHLITAHYREILIKYPDNNIKNVIQETWNNPFDLSDFDSLILIIIGYFITILVIFKSYNYDDRYPHHGKKVREYNMAKKKIEVTEKLNRKNFDDEKSNLNNSLGEINNIDFGKQKEIVTSNLKRLDDTNKELKKFFEDIKTNSRNYLTLFRTKYNSEIDSDHPHLIDNNDLDNCIEKIMNKPHIKDYTKEDNMIADIKKLYKEANELLLNIVSEINKSVKNFNNLIEQEEEKYKELSKFDYKTPAINKLKEHGIKIYIKGNENV